ncbi:MULTISPECIES: hypothetical protein [Ralstonia]|uniref:hypothetical protein n=1 Tax=Ralstonia TaxID=48736 RepID=UPI000C79F223|nr:MULTISPECIES: hypothetical protein [Ralstonia]PLT16305.1 hypothetical protein CXP34_19335 [Ralstonia mannitolilytica]
MKKAFVFEIDTDRLPNVSDEYLAALWHLAQHQPVKHGDHDAGALVEHIGREIVLRWLRGVPVPVWNIQGSDYYVRQLGRFAHWNGCEWVAGAAAQPTVPEIL